MSTSRPRLDDVLDWSATLLAARIAPDGTITEANAALARVLGDRPEGRPAAELVSPPQRGALERLLASAPAEGILALALGQGDGATDYRVRVATDGDATLLVAEAPVAEAERLLDQVLALNHDLIEARRALETAARRDREIALSLQRSLLPAHLPEVPGLRLAARYLPGGGGMEVGGDFYDVVVQPGGCVMATIGDVAGRGLPAATVMGQLRAATHAYALEGHPPGELLEHLNRLMLSMDLFATAACAAIDPATGEVVYAAAGHPPPLHVDADGGRLLDQPGGTPLGLEARPAREGRATLAPAAALVLYTDGLVERRDEAIDTSLARLADAAGTTTDPDEVCQRLLMRLGAEDVGDDVAMLAVSRI
jgi:serine phosphatase RsbU (regulator of sigma subunit)